MVDGLGGGSTDLFTKIGPLPAWAWATLAVGGYLAYQHFSSPAPVSTLVDDTDIGGESDAYAGDAPVDMGDSGGGSLTVPDTSGDAGYNYGDVNQGTYTGTVAGTTFTSNQQWAVYTISFLVREGYPASTTTSAITHYLAGNALTDAEANIVAKAIALVGPPPLPMPINHITTTNTGIPGSTRLSGHVTTDHRMALSWTKVAGASIYAVYRDGVLIAMSRDTSRASARMKVGTKHTWYVRVVGTNGRTGPASNKVTLTIR